MKAQPILPFVILALAFAVGMATLLPYTNIIPRRSLWSILVGLTFICGSYAELILVFLFAYRWKHEPKVRTKLSAASLLLGVMASIPAVTVSFTLYQAA